ncbi:ABC transporter permease [Flaviflexus huanghaiensis]|uniref:ABC transporter permease n=1 Tax=Flaviflexus huanghaiensis TaxID=1111473 RepID=UPI0015FBBEE6|nr:FtsX-like permease family protein [Flaviflexus huanghaiensis]
MWQVTLRGIRAHLGRFLLTALSVMLGIAFLSGTLALRDVLGQTFSNLSAGTATTDLSVRGTPIESENAFDGANSPLSDTLTAEIEQVDGVDTAIPVYSGNAILIGNTGQPANVGQAPPLGFAWVEQTDSQFLSAGRAPESRDEVVLESGTAEAAGLSVGDSAVVLIDAAPMDVEVVGIVSFGSSVAGASITLLENDFARESFSPNGMVSEIGVLIGEGASPETVASAIEAALDVDVLTSEEVQAETEEQVSFVLDLINTFLLVFVAIALGIGIFIITNTFRISVRQRQKEFALLRAIGAAPRQVFSVVFVQAIIIGLIGSALGVLLGQGLILAVRAAIEALGFPLDADLVIPSDVVVLSIVIGVIVTVISALMPARSAALTPPIEAMRETSGASEKPLKVRSLIGIVTLTIGVVTFIVGSLRMVEAAGWAIGIGAFLIVASVIILSPALIRPAVAVLGWPARRWSPVLGKIASESTAASPRKTASTASALMIGVALVATGATLAASIKASLNDIIETSVSADLLVTMNVPITDPSAGVAAMESVEGVENVDASVRFGAALTADETPKAQTTTAMSTSAISLLGLEVVDGSLDEYNNGQVAALHESFAESEELGVGDEITLLGVEGPVTLEVGAVLSSEIIMSPIYVPQETFDQLRVDTSFVALMIIDVAEGYEITEVKDDVIAAVEDMYIFQVLDEDGLKGLVGQTVDTVLTTLYALLGLSIVIAALGIVNTLSLSVADRTREIGLLRAIGLSKRGVRGTLLVESIIMSVLGAVIGIVVGVPLAIGLNEYVSDDSTAIIHIPYLSLGVMLVAAVIVGILASILPARRAARLNVLDAIATE